MSAVNRDKKIYCFIHSICMYKCIIYNVYLVCFSFFLHLYHHFPSFFLMTIDNQIKDVAISRMMSSLNSLLLYSTVIYCTRCSVFGTRCLVLGFCRFFLLLLLSVVGCRCCYSCRCYPCKFCLLHESGSLFTNRVQLACLNVLSR